MLRPIFYLLILPLFFFSCMRQGSNSESTTNIIESADIEPVNKDSIIMPSVQYDQTKDLLLVEGSVQKAFDTLSLEFNLSDKDYEIVYKKEERLYFFDSKSHNSMIFPDTSRIFQFVFSSDGNTLYYTVINNDSLFLKQANLIGNKARISSIRSFDGPLNEFSSPWTGQGSRIEIHGDTLSIGHGGTNEHYSFKSTFYIVADTDSSYLIESLPPHYYQKSSEDYHKHIASVSEKLRLVKKGEHKELFLISYPENIQLSDIDSLYKEHDFDVEYEVESYKNFDRMLFKTVEFSPDGSKILYSYPCVLYDFLHGPMYVVNVNGEKLKRLTIDGGFSREQRPAWLPDGNNVIFHRARQDDSANISGLYMTINPEHDIMKIEEQVGQYEIR